MAGITASITERDLLAGLLWTVGYTTGNLAGSGGSELFGLSIGPNPVIFQNRTYGGTVDIMRVELYKDPYSGGTPVNARNRNLKILLPGPVSYASNVTATPTNFETGLNIYAGGVGTSDLGTVPEGEWYMLDADTQYVLKIINNGTAGGVINFRWTYKGT